MIDGDPALLDDVVFLLRLLELLLRGEELRFAIAVLLGGQQTLQEEVVILLVILFGLLVADARGSQSVFRVRERLSLIEVGLDARQDIAALHQITVAMKDGNDFARDGALHVHLDLRLDVADFRHFHLNISDFRFACFDRQLRRLIAVALRLHRHENDDDDQRQTGAGEDRELLLSTGCTHAPYNARQSERFQRDSPQRSQRRLCVLCGDYKVANSSFGNTRASTFGCACATRPSSSIK